MFVAKLNAPISRGVAEVKRLMLWLFCLCIGVCIMLVKMKQLGNRMKREVQALIDTENARIAASGRKLKYEIMEQGHGQSYVYVRCTVLDSVGAAGGG